MSQEELKELKNIIVTLSLEECKIKGTTPPGIEMNDSCDKSILAMFPKPKRRVPPVFLHKPVKFPPHMCEVLNMGIKIYPPIVGHHYTRICCATFDDHKGLVNYFHSKQLPYHTYDHPENRKLRVVVKGLPNDIDLDCFMKELRSASIPVIRAHKMHNQERAKDRPVLVLVVVPNDNEGRKILYVKKVFGHEIKIEPPKQKAKQCHNCQKWGHSQRYCRGNTKCVKCSGNHLSMECSRNPTKEPPRCANCINRHTANFKKCSYCPDSKQYKDKQQKIAQSKSMFPTPCNIPRKLVTLENCHLFLRGRV